MDWSSLRSILMGYPKDSLHGRLREHGGPEDAPSDEVLIWREGRSLRVEVNGEPHYITDGVTVWNFHATKTIDSLRGTPLIESADDRSIPGRGQEFLAPRSARDWSGTDFTEPEGPVAVERFENRDCWTVAFRAPAHKIGPLRMWVDQESGYLLRMANEHPDAAGSAQWIDNPTIGVPLQDALFSWHGPTVTQQDIDDIRKAEINALRNDQRAWFRENVTEMDLTLPAKVSIIPNHFSDQGHGSFTLGNAGMVLRAENYGDDNQQVTINFRNSAVVRDMDLELDVQRRFGGGDLR